MPLPPDLANFQTFKDFAAEWHAQGLGTKYSLRWLSRYRAENGMLASGALIELRTPGHKRPRILVNRARLIEWLESQNQGGAK